MLRTKKIVLLLLLVFSSTLLLEARDAFGQGTAAELPPEARKAFQVGTEALHQGAWTIAIKNFMAAHEAVPTAPEVLSNLGLVHSRAGNHLAAIIWLRAYLAVAPQAPDAPQVKVQIAIQEGSIQEKIKELQAQAKAMDLKIYGEGKSSGVYSVSLAFVRGYAEDGDIPRALEMAAGLPEGSWEKASALRDIAGAQVKAGNISGALKTAAQLSEGKEKAYALSDIAGAQVKAGNISGALKTAAQIPEGSWQKASALNDIAGAQVKAGDISGALKTAAQLPDGSWEKGYALRDIGEAQVKAGDVASARKSLSYAELLDWRGLVIDEERWYDLKSEFSTPDFRWNQTIITDLKGYYDSQIKWMKPEKVSRFLTVLAQVLGEALKIVQDKDREWRNIE